MILKTEILLHKTNHLLLKTEADTTPEDAEVKSGSGKQKIS